MSATREPQPNDLLTSREVADMYGWPVERADAYIRALARGGVKLERLPGFRRIFVRRADLEAHQSSGGKL